MPKFDHIIINLVDLDNVIKIIADEKPAGGAVQIFMDSDSIIIRDKDGMLIGALDQTKTNDA